MDRSDRPRALLPRPRLGGAGQRLHQPQHDVYDVQPHARGGDAQAQRRRARVRQSPPRVGGRVPTGSGQPGAPMSQAASPGADWRGQWPALPLEEWTPTRETLHMWLQIVGKIRLAKAPMVNHWWQIPLYLTPRGLTTTV